MRLVNTVLIGFSLLAGNLRIQASEVVPWLRGTYTPFVTEGADPVLAEHKGLSPLMGAIAWESGWIKGLYTWGIGEKHVKAPGAEGAGAVAAQALAKVAAEGVGGAGPAEPVAAPVVPRRIHDTWVGNDKTTQLVRELFYDAAGDIRPTKSKHPFFLAITNKTHLAWFLDILKTGSMPEKDKDFKIAGSKKFFTLVAQSREECGEGKRYPAFVTDQILSAYYYAIQFLPDIRQSDSLVNSVKQALERYMRALGIVLYKPVSYEVSFLRGDGCPASVDEAALVKKLYQKVTAGNVPPLANYKSFSYRGASDRGSCVETMIRNFFNVLLYDAERQRYTVELLPENLQKSALPGFITFYRDATNAAVANTDLPNVHDSWLEVVSALPGAALNYSSGYTPARDHIVYLGENSYIYGGVTKSGFFELDSTPQNVLLVINTLLGTHADTFEALSSQLSTPDRRVELISFSEGEGFVVRINATPLVRFTISSGHSFAELINPCVPGEHVLSCVTDSQLKTTEALQYALLTRDVTAVTEQEAHYLLYAAGVRDYDWLVKTANISCPPAHADMLFAAVANKLAQRSPDAFRRLSDIVLLYNVAALTSGLDDLLRLSIVWRHGDGLRLLLEHGANPNSKDSNGNPVLGRAIVRNFTDGVKLLLERGANPNSQDSRGDPVLVHAIEGKFTDGVKLLLEHGADPEAKDSRGNSVLGHAIEGKFTDGVKLLLEHGANPNSQDSRGDPVLVRAVSKNSADGVKLLLEHGANPNSQDSRGDPVLVHAIWEKFTDGVKLLLEYGADSNSKDSQGNSVLVYAIREKFTDGVKLLLEHNADSKSKDRDGNSVLVYAVMENFTDGVKLLLEHGADPNLKDSRGNLALVHAVRESFTDGVELLLEYGADVLAQNASGQTALTIAQTMGNRHIIWLLRQAEKRAQEAAGRAESSSPVP